MNITVLRTIIDGAGQHEPGSEINLPDSDAERLIRLGAAVKAPSPANRVQQEPVKKPEEAGEEFLTDAEIVKIKEVLFKVSGMTDEIADGLIEKGIQSLEDLSKTKKADLLDIKGFDSKNVEKILRSARVLNR